MCVTDHSIAQASNEDNEDNGFSSQSTGFKVELFFRYYRLVWQKGGTSPQMREPQAELMLAMRSSISRSAADGGRGSCAPGGAPSVCGAAAPARLHPLLLPMLLLPVCIASRAGMSNMPDLHTRASRPQSRAEQVINALSMIVQPYCEAILHLI